MEFSYLKGMLKCLFLLLKPYSFVDPSYIILLLYFLILNTLVKWHHPNYNKVPSHKPPLAANEMIASKSNPIFLSRVGEKKQPWQW